MQKGQGFWKRSYGGENEKKTKENGKRKKMKMGFWKMKENGEEKNAFAGKFQGFCRLVRKQKGEKNG